MLHFSRIPLAVLLVALVVGPTSAQEPIRLGRTPDISPDGKLVAFSYLGDIWTVETIGGTARAITSHPAHDISPVFSPDGRHLAFSSNRHGSYDIYVVPVQGGRPTRLTVDSSSEQVCGWSPDGKSILYASTRSTAFPPSYELYTVPIQGGMSRRLSTAEGKEGVFSPAGDRVAYVRGPGTWYRKGYRGSSSDDIWICNADGTNNRQVTSFDGQDSSPMWSSDGKTLYYVSEVHGAPANVVRQNIAPALPAGATSATASKPQQITFHKDDGVRRARISRDGQWIVYECGADLWIVSTHDSAAPRKLAIEVNADDKSNPEQLKIFTNSATEFSLSADEKHIAFVVQGKLFRRKIGPENKVVQMTFGSCNDHNAAWAPDGSKIIFISDRNGHEDLYLLEADDPDNKKAKCTEAQRFKIKQITTTPEAEIGVGFSPDGKRVSFLRAGKLWTMNPDGSDQKAIVKDVHVFDYEWSPDSKWIVYARRDGSFASELYIVPAKGASNLNPARNITRYATYNADVTWSHDGKKIAFLSDRRGSANLFVLPLQRPAAEGVKESGSLFGRSSVSIDWEDIHLRAVAASPLPAHTAAISADGSKVAFVDAIQHDLWVANSNGGELRRLTGGRVSPRQIAWSKQRGVFGSLGNDVIYYLDRNGSLQLIRASGAPGPPLSFRIKMRIRTEDLYLEMFDQSWRYLAEHFYDAKYHDHDWDAVRAKYRPLVKHVSMKEDLYSLLYLMLGELNASHLGIMGHFTFPDEETADLGLIFDEGYRGRGLKIAEVLKRGPADRRGLTIKEGQYVLSIDGEELSEKKDLSALLNGKVGESVSLQVAAKPDAPAKEWKRIEITAVSRGTIVPLMYDRWVDKNARRVAELSKGKLGYIHIPSMDDDGLDRFLRSLYSDNYDKEGIVLDVRFNGGGFTHDKVLNYLGSRQHTIFKERNGGQGLVLRSSDRKWHKPLVLLINNRSYSDAEIFPSAFRTLGLGKLVGQPTGGFVIGTGAVQLIDGSLLRIPRIGVYTTKGVNMEKQGVVPDVVVEDHPDQLAKGIDSQLAKAVEVLQKDVLTWQQKNQGDEGSKTSEVGAANPPGSPSPPSK